MPHYDFFCHACWSPVPESADSRPSTRKARSYTHIASAKKWNDVFRLSALSRKRERMRNIFEG